VASNIFQARPYSWAVIVAMYGVSVLRAVGGISYSPWLAILWPLMGIFNLLVVLLVKLSVSASASAFLIIFGVLAVCISVCAALALRLAYHLVG